MSLTSEKSPWVLFERGICWHTRSQLTRAAPSFESYSVVVFDTAKAQQFELALTASENVTTSNALDRKVSFTDSYIIGVIPENDRS